MRNMNTTSSYKLGLGWLTAGLGACWDLVAGRCNVSKQKATDGRSLKAYGKTYLVRYLMLQSQSSEVELIESWLNNGVSSNGLSTEKNTFLGLLEWAKTSNLSKSFKEHNYFKTTGNSSDLVWLRWHYRLDPDAPGWPGRSRRAALQTWWRFETGTSVAAASDLNKKIDGVSR
jgi:hypothetical protein